MAKEFIFPDVGEGIHEGTIVKWHFKEGDAVKADQTIVEVETDKAVVELPSPATGTILKINYTVGQVVKVGQVLVVIGQPGEAYTPSAPAVHGEAKPSPAPQPVAQPAQPEREPLSQQPTGAGHAMASPATRKLAREMGVDLAVVRGTGPGGRITDEDVKMAASGGAAPAQPATAPTAPAAAPGGRPEIAGPRVPVEEGDTVVPLTHLRKVIADKMLYSKTHIPHACGMDYVDVTKLSELREKEKKNFEPRGVKLTYLPFIVKAVAIALKEMPQFNAHFDNDKNQIVLKKAHNIGIAVDTPEGLMVPVVKDVDRRSIVEIAQEIEHLAVQARERKLKLEDMKGGTFTITNIGSVGGMYSSPIINPPEVAIMGVHRIKEVPLVIDGKIKARKILGLSVCFDHRVNDGAAATLFMNVVMKHLEDPDLMLVDMI
ncbi:MAG TPA: dihydrolipoamide acetyltransferase family protein [Candidatus Bilamarchaeum sp.]|nr:dihydrolipoamide acetyltransferase family protein [Candidatus Bilamarchaeum sp.]